MLNNNKWIFEQIKPYLGNSILEIGSGIGNVSKFLAPLRNDKIVLADINKTYLEYLRYRFIGNPKVKIILHDILSKDISGILRFQIDTVLCINVLEHIRDDEEALKNIYRILEKKGRLIIVVPASKYLYSSLDRHLGHFRRYEKNELVRKLEGKKFVIEKIYFHNFISTLGWFVNGRILKKKTMSSFQVGILDKFIPFFAKAEEMIKIPFGLSLIVICRKK
jgi:SAM-dependent methyltransferase